jgi:aspartyl/asparaginyl beta-hydroxylase (cupin superfamily)
MGPIEALRGWRRQTVIRVGKSLRPWLDRILVRYSLVDDPDVFSGGEFPWVGEVEARWREIRRELDTVLAHRDLLPQLTDISADHAKISDAGKWQVFILHGYGQRMDCARELCPATLALLDRVPNLYTAFFSILAPGVEVPRHRGVTQGFITWHIGLKTPHPEEHCFIELGGRRCHWSEGESLVFDDTRHHRVRNETDGERAVLLINFLRPMRWPGRLLLGVFLAAMNRTRWITDARSNQARWERQFLDALRKSSSVSERAA